jgi:hypothetical protein
MSAQTITESIIDVAADHDRLAHLPCGQAHQQPDQPMHALCGQPLLGIDATADATRCTTCVTRMEQGGPIAAWTGRLHCAKHTPGGSR